MAYVETAVSSSRNVTVVNPLDLLIDAIIKSASNDDERLLAKEGRQRILEFHERWNKILAGQTDDQFTVAETVAGLRWGSRAPFYVHTQKSESAGYVDYPTITLVEKAVVRGKEFLPASYFLTRILDKLGAFNQDQAEPPEIFGSLPTSISGVSLAVEMNSYNPMIRAQMDIQTFQQALSFPLRMRREPRSGRIRSFAGKLHLRNLL